MSVRTILLKGKIGRRYDEARLSVAAYPGYLMQASLTTDVGKIKPHVTAGGKSTRAFLIEDDFQGKTARDQYAIGDLGRIIHADVGDILWAVLKAGQTVAANGLLKSNGDGTLTPAGSGETTDNCVGRAVVALDLSASGSDDFVQIIVI